MTNIQKVLKPICDNLNIVEILPVLLAKKLIIPREAGILMNIAKNSSNYEAAMDLVLNMLSNRKEDWYAKFLLCLLEADYKALAKEIDEPLCRCKYLHALITILTLSKISLYTQRKPQVCSNAMLDTRFEYINY